MRRLTGSLKRAARVALTAALGFGVLLPTVQEASAGTPVLKLVMYEVAETLVLKQRAGKDDGAGLAQRLAQASLLAKDVQVLSPDIPAVQFAVADAKSNVSLVPTSRTYLTGPVSGTIHLLTDIDPTRNSLDTLVIAADIEIAGTLDLRPAAQYGYAGISGQWRSKSLGLSGTFEGAFAIAFQLAGLGDGYWYPNLGAGACANGTVDLGAICSVTTEEFLLGVPLTKAVVTFTADDTAGKK